MISRSLLLLRRVTRQLWFRVVAISLFSLLALAVAPLLAPILPQEWENRFGRDAVLPVLNILATGMLAVTTFSLNVMVSAYRTASTMATPRVYRLLLEDTVTQSVLATFTGGFVYSLSAIILFRARLYPPGAAFVVFVMTVLVVALIVIAILRWIDHLSDLGSMDHTLRLIETRTRNSLQARKDTPSLGGCCDTSEPPADARPIAAAESGFVRFVDMPALNARAEEAGVTIHLTRLPGEFGDLYRGTVIDVVGEVGVDIAQWVVRQSGQMHHGIKALEVVQCHIADVLDNRGYVTGCIAVGAPAVEVGVETDYIEPLAL